jgi:uncharacterized protein YcbX
VDGAGDLPPRPARRMEDGPAEVPGQARDEETPHVVQATLARMLASGRVVSLHRWPVKSMQGEAVDALDVDVIGAAGDRAHALFDEHGGAPQPLTIRQVPRLLLWKAGYGAAAVTLHDPPRPTLTSPAGAVFAWDDPALRDALAADLGRAVTPRRDPGLMQDLEDSLLVTTGASHRDAEAALGPLDPLRWRTNVHVELDADAHAEAGWEGAELVVGEARFALLHPCVRCVIPTRAVAADGTLERTPELLRWLARERGTIFGINARALGPGRIATGDPVTVRQP